MEHLTVCCREGRLLLKAAEHKQIVLNSITFLAKEQRVWLYGFVILEDEVHLLWKKRCAWETRNVRQMLLKFTAQRIKQHMLRSPDTTLRYELEQYKCEEHDRQFRFWEPSANGPTVTTRHAAEEILEHMHEAPVISGLCLPGATYPFSSAACYQNGEDPLQIITHYSQYFSG